MEDRRRRLWAALSCLAILMMTAAAYIDDYYRAGDAARRAMVPDEAVRVSDEGDYIAFDGPGTGTALALYPGAKVEPTAYAPLLRQVAERGVDAFLIKSPLRLSILDIEAAGRVMAAEDYDRWFLAGHSMGGAAASAYAARHPGGAEGLILLAAFPADPLPDGLRLLSVYGDQDGVLNRARYDRERILWPEDSQERVLAGANHAGFGDYGPQRGDGAAELTGEEQRRLAAEMMAAFCGAARRGEVCAWYRKNS